MKIINALGRKHLKSLQIDNDPYFPMTKLVTSTQ